MYVLYTADSSHQPSFTCQAENHAHCCCQRMYNITYRLLLHKRHYNIFHYVINVRLL